jgi:peroxiredoxin
MVSSRCFLIAVSIVCGSSVAIAQSNADGQLPVTQYEEPYLLLIRDPIVHQDLKLTGEQQRAIDAWNDEISAPLMATRNKPTDEGLKIARELIVKSRQHLATVLSEAQRQRLSELEFQTQGLRVLLRKEAADKLALTDKQRQQMTEILADLEKEQKALFEQAQAGEPVKPLEKKYRTAQTDANKRINAALRPEQRAQLVALRGKPADIQRFGKVKFKAPELLGEGPWVNSDPLTLERLRGKVVVLHFWTFGCINCIHNYPSYQNWLKKFADRDVVLLGIHTPETRGEYNVDTIRKKVAENELNYPTIVDNEKANWNAWGNSMWPTVYLIDKQGYIRYWWMGELNWQDQEGEKLFTQRIEDLLRE